MREPPRAPCRTVEPALDVVSAQLAEVLRRADGLLAEWASFGVEVRRQVDREAAAIGELVAGALDRAAFDHTAARVDRAFAGQVGARLAGLTAELARLEARARSTTSAIADERRGDRRALWLIALGIVIANGLLVAQLTRRSDPAPMVIDQPARSEIAPPIAVGSGSGSNVVPPAQGSGSAIVPVPTPPVSPPPTSVVRPRPVKAERTK